MQKNEHPRPPGGVKSVSTFQFPNSDPCFRQCYELLDLCYALNGGCDDCHDFQRCRAELDYLAGRCQDRRLEPERAMRFISEFVLRRSGGEDTSK